MMNSAARVGRQPAVDAAGAATPFDDHLFVTGVESDHVVAVQKASGAVAWRNAVPTNPGYHHSNSLLPHPPTNSVIAVVGNIPVAFDARSGAVVWRAKELKHGGARPTSTMDVGVLADQADEDAWFAATSSDRGSGDNTKEARADDDAFLRNLIVFAVNYQVNAIRLSDGLEQWTFTNRELGSSPTVLIEDGVVFVGGEGVLYALNARTGSQIWGYRIDEIKVQLHIATMRSSTLYRPRNYDPSSPRRASPPPPAEKKSAAPAAPPLYVATLKEILQLDPASGEFVPGAPAIRHGFSDSTNSTGIIPLPATHRALVWCGDAMLVCDTHSGAAVWQKKIPTSRDGDSPNVVCGPGAPPIRPAAAAKAAAPADPAAPPAYSASASSSLPLSSPDRGNRLYICIGDALVCLDPATGALLWKKTFGGLFTASPGAATLVADPTPSSSLPPLLFAGGSGSAFAFDARTGEQVWRKKLRDGAHHVSVATDGAGNGEVNRGPEIGPALAATLLINL